MELQNRLSRKELQERLSAEDFRRITLSFYRYVKIEDPLAFRDSLFSEWHSLNCLGRIYVAHEGINAQMSVPEHAIDAFRDSLAMRSEFNNVVLKYAVDDNGKSFIKLTIKVRPKIVADGLNDEFFKPSDTGRSLSPLDFHALTEDRNVIVVDMRNHYESEIGHFKGAFRPEADTFRDAITIVKKNFENQKDKKYLLYCTGGIRCEKASAWLKHNGFMDVNQLEGGIIAYAHEIKKAGLASKFIGKNFVFDQRLGETIDGSVISRCHQCGSPCDTHTNCANNNCHLLFIQCSKCNEVYEGCCSVECKKAIA
jgi:UPF0176 protein